MGRIQIKFLLPPPLLRCIFIFVKFYNLKKKSKNLIWSHFRFFRVFWSSLFSQSLNNFFLSIFLILRWILYIWVFFNSLRNSIYLLRIFLNNNNYVGNLSLECIYGLIPAAGKYLSWCIYSILISQGFSNYYLFSNEIN